MKLTDENKVSIVAGVSLLCLYVVLKYVLHVSDVSWIIILYTFCYWLFGFFSHAKGKEVKKSKWENPLYWRILIITLITVATIALYAI
jgi:ABC-type phosphate/phosphonate transport system permease subunit